MIALWYLAGILGAFLLVSINKEVKAQLLLKISLIAFLGPVALFGSLILYIFTRYESRIPEDKV